MKTHFLAWIGTILISASGIAVFFRKNITNILKVIKISRDVLDIIDSSVEASTDEKLTPEEVQEIIDLVNKLKSDLTGKGENK